MKYFRDTIGARYFVAMACHHDHFDCWDSSHHAWNSVNVGPKRDLMGEFEKSARKYHLPFGVSSHDDRYLSWWLPAFGADKSGPKKGVPYDGNLTKADGKGKWWEGLDPADLYGLPPNKRTPQWIKSVKENWLERGVPNSLQTRTFQSITTLRNWFYKLDVDHMEPQKNARTLAEMLADVISKGRNMLLNVELTGSGALPPDLKYIYDDFGAWVHINAEAIYASHPWKVFGDNRPEDVIARRNLDATDLKAAKKHSEQFNERTVKTSPYPHDEVRFTVKGNKLYIFVLNPKLGNIQLPTLGLKSKLKPGKITQVKMLGGSKVSFQQNDSDLTFEVPEKRPNKYVTVFRVDGAL